MNKEQLNERFCFDKKDVTGSQLEVGNDYFLYDPTDGEQLDVVLDRHTLNFTKEDGFFFGDDSANQIELLIDSVLIIPVSK